MKDKRKSDAFTEKEFNDAIFKMAMLTINKIRESAINKMNQEIKLNLGEGYQKPMYNFKVGDRVVFYSGIRNKGIIIEIGNQIIVRQDRKDIQQETVGLFYLHPKQCRKLKKRVVRRAWVCPDFIQRMDNDFDGLLGIKGKPQEGWTEFVEVRKK